MVSASNEFQMSIQYSRKPEFFKIILKMSKKTE